MEDTKYNGWTNYETWNVKLWMDQGSSDLWDEAACEAYRNADASSHSTKRQQATYDLAEMLKGEHTENNPPLFA